MFWGFWGVCLGSRKVFKGWRLKKNKMENGWRRVSGSLNQRFIKNIKDGRITLRIDSRNKRSYEYGDRLGRMWDIIIVKFVKGEGTTTEYLETENTKQQAIKFAHQYMRTH